METSAISGGQLAVILETSVTINTFLNSEAKTESPGSPESVHSFPLFILTSVSKLFSIFLTQSQRKWKEIAWTV